MNRELCFGHININGLLTNINGGSTKLDLVLGYMLKNNILIMSICEHHLKIGIQPHHIVYINGLVVGVPPLGVVLGSLYITSWTLYS